MRFGPVASVANQVVHSGGESLWHGGSNISQDRSEAVKDSRMALHELSSLRIWAAYKEARFLPNMQSWLSSFALERFLHF